ncbi:WD40 repeat domain-containing protein [Aspergillus thermomutatus]|uniref:Mitochondrial division protein 1 n=1 Tax=Aspergillus thermomutatus TaxID=41047 RepID=A0A397HBX7_ASPTH|nr:uncharacterized protein CDV56_107574 [Aspergillus thermomutatus]RHZ57930.1 hypothetical protein CDV56_107574 [Aspergillus thermomutatus]
MDNSDHRSKRRRVQSLSTQDVSTPENNFIYSPIDSSSDELAAASDHDEQRRRVSWTAQKVYPPKRPYRRTRSFSGSESPDELAVDADVYWRSRNRGRSPSHSETSAQEQSPERYQDDELEVDEEESAGSAEVDQEYSDRSPTPVPPPAPPPPPKPEKLTYQQKFLLRGHLRGVSAVRFSPDSTMIASGGADGAVKVWDTRSGKLIHTFEGHLAGISTISWSPDGATIASGSDDKTIRLWNVLTVLPFVYVSHLTQLMSLFHWQGKAHPIPFVGHHNYVYQIAFSPKGNMLVSGSYDEAVFLWDVRSASVMRSLPAHSDPVGGIDVVWDGTLIVSCATDGLIRIWDTATGQCLRTLVHEDNPPVTAVKFSPNGKFVLAWTLDDCVRLWNYVEGRCIKTYQGHVNRKYSLLGGFGIYGLPGAPPEAFVVSGSEDGSILCWDVVSKKILQRLEGHNGVVLGVDTCILGEQRLMVSCGLDGTVRVWEEVEEAAESDEVDVKAEVNGEDAGDGGNAENGVVADEAVNDLPVEATPQTDEGDGTDENKDQDGDTLMQ